MHDNLQFSANSFFQLFTACECSSFGSSSTSCTSSGVCTCKSNIIGNKCTNCTSGYYGFPNCQGMILNTWIIY